MDRVILGKTLAANATPLVDFTEAHRSDFNNSLDGWTPNSKCTLTAGNFYATYETTGLDPNISTPVNHLDFDGSIYNMVRIRLRRMQYTHPTSGLLVFPSWHFQFFWESTAGGFADGNNWVGDEPNWDGIGWATIIIDLSDQVGWTGETIQRFRLDLGNSAEQIGTKFLIDSIVADDGISKTYTRGEKTGLFVSKPGANVMSCSDGDLIFDSTATDFMQVLAKGKISVPSVSWFDNYMSANSVIVVNTGVELPDKEEGAIVSVSWDLLKSTSNLHPIAFSSDWDTSETTDYALVPQNFALRYNNLGRPNKNNHAFNFPITAEIVANTSFQPKPSFNLEPFWKRPFPRASELPPSTITNEPFTTSETNPWPEFEAESITFPWTGSDARWSPDGTTIYFSAYRYAVWQFGGVGFEQPGKYINPRWTQDFYYNGLGGQSLDSGMGIEIYKIAVDQDTYPTPVAVGQPTQITSHPYTNIPAGVPDVPHSGRRIAYVEELGNISPAGTYAVTTRNRLTARDMYKVNLSSGAGTLITGTGVTSVSLSPWVDQPNWNPSNGGQIVYREYKRNATSTTITGDVDNKILLATFSSEADASATVTTLLDDDITRLPSGATANYYSFPTYSPDGTKIALQQLAGSTYALAADEKPLRKDPSIWVMDSNGTNLKRISPRGIGPSASTYGRISWTPDSKFVIVNHQYDASFNGGRNKNTVHWVGEVPQIPVGIYTFDVTGTPYTPLSLMLDGNPNSSDNNGDWHINGGVSVSPNGKRILYERNSYYGHFGVGGPASMWNNAGGYYDDLRIMELADPIVNPKALMDIHFKTGIRADGYLADLTDVGGEHHVISWTLYKRKGL